ncbi:unnamed protein product, partial [Mesorhabditis belari]|uniref:Uncharacterized protein n=1 Tax=Mesorhabditis belari TaxID=2138241 RepID=A0AAF3EUX7_9BILA
MAFFTFNGVTKKLKVAAVKPAVLSTVFKLEPDSIVITDDDEGEVHLADGARFDPPLIDGHRYSVDGAELASVVAQRTAEMERQAAADRLAAANQMAIYGRERDVAGIKGQQRDNLITVLISTTSDLDQSVGMLYNAPQAVVLVEALAILAAAAPDPSLVSENMPAEKFTRLKTPSSFKASLYQVASSMCNAFRTADVSMMTIKAKLVDLPDDFVSTLEVIGENDDVATQKILKRTTGRIAEASKKCVEMAKKSSETFRETIDVIDELCQAAIVAKGTNEAALTEWKKLKVDLDQRKQALQISEQDLRQQHEERKERAKEALQEYKDQVANSGNVGKMFLAFTCDGIMDTVKAAVSLPGKALEILGEKLPKLPGTEKCSPTMRYAMEWSLLQMLEQIIGDLAHPGEMGEETVKDYILSLKDSERVSVGNVIVAAKSVREDRQKAKDEKTAAQLSFAEKLVQAETDQIRMSQSYYTEESQKEEKLRKELKETTMELSGILGKLKNLDLEKVDLDDIISYLQDGIQYLGKVKENWNELTNFFDAILILVETNLKDNIDSFLQEAQDPASRGRMLRSALKATGYCIQAGNCAQIYTQVSSQYVMPTINGVGKQFALTNAEAKAKKGDIENMLNAMALAQTLKTRYAEQKEEIEQVYRSFKGVLMKLKNMCSDDARIIREIKDMHQQLTIKYKKIDLFDVELRDEQLEEEEILRQLQRKNERHDEDTKNCVNVQGGLAGAMAGLGALAVIFPPVGVPALIAAGGTAAGGLTAGVIGIIEQAQKASQEKLNSLRENISNVGRHLDQLKKEIKKDEEWVQWYWKQIDEANKELDKARRHIAKCRMMQENGNIWLLGELLINRLNFSAMIRYTSNSENLKRNSPKQDGLPRRNPMYR